MTADRARPLSGASPKLPVDWFAVLGFAALAAPTCLSLAQQQWSRDSGAHGPIVLAMGGWLLWRAWPDLVMARRPGDVLVTAALLAFALPVYVFGRAYDFLTLEAAGAYVAGFAVLQSRFGLRTLRRAWFPILYLGFVIPPPQSLLDSATAPLKALVSFLATTGLSAAGVPVARQGVTIFVDQYQLLVEDACSGLNSIVGLTAITLLYVYLVRGTGWVRPFVLCAMILPVAILANVIRITVLVLVTYGFGDAVAQGFVHYTTGIALFAGALVLMYGLDQGLAFWSSRGRRR